jgi:uncharacterized protein (TIGR02452 family)
MFFNVQAHNERIAVFKDTMSRIESDSRLQQAVSSSIAAQVFYPEGQPIALPTPPYTEPAQVIVTKNRSFEAARPYAEQGLKIAVLNFASSTNPGGGVTSGASAQEECLCRVSTLYPCLKDESMWDAFYAPHRKARNPLHNDDIIYTKDVIVFKDDDYQPLPKPFTVDIITCAAPTLREQSSNRYNPSDGDKAPDITPEDLLALHEKRGRQILSAAAANGAEVIVLGAFGCGAFKNDPAIVAQAYANILPEYLHHFRTIEFAIYCRPHEDSNYRAFKEIIRQ